ncbi:hypothetical protein P8610_01440 [Fictibacillus sp. UD]
MSCGTSGQVRHLRVGRPNVAHRLPRGKRAPGTEINHFQELPVKKQQKKHQRKADALFHP